MTSVPHPTSDPGSGWPQPTYSSAPDGAAPPESAGQTYPPAPPTHAPYPPAQFGQPQGYPPPPAAPAGSSPYPTMASGYPAPPAWVPPNAPSAYNAPQVQQKLPQVALLVPIAAVLAVAGACTPWFKPAADLTTSDGTTGQLVGDSLYSWKDGRIGLLAPILLVVLAISLISLMRGKSGGRFTRGSIGPVKSAARSSIIVGVVSGVCLTVAYFLVQTQYKIDLGTGGGKQSWSDAEDYVRSTGGSLSISHGLQIGFWLTAAAAVLAVVAGVAMFVVKGEQTPAPPPMLQK